MDDTDPRQQKSLCRYHVISAYLAMEPARGQRRALLEQLASRSWTGPDGQPFHVAAETIRVWVRRFRQNGLKGLEDKPRSTRGRVRALPEGVADVVCAMKREVPERSLDRIIRILEKTEKVEPGQVRRSTLHRVLQREGISARAARTPDRQDLDRFEADVPNELWQSDMLVGPWLPDPKRPGKMRRANLFAFLDDHSRKVLFGRFSFKEDLPALELVFRRSLQRFGVPKKAYYDNGQVYRSRHMEQVIATLGIHRAIFTKPYRPMGHGKIEAFNRYVRAAFLSEIKASSITTMEALNEAFLAWLELEYNHRVHSEIGETPEARWRRGIDDVRYADERLLEAAFTWKERRTPDKSGIFSLFGVRYQAGAEVAKRRIEIHYDPEALGEVEVYLDGRFVQRAKPFEVSRHRRPKAPATRDANAATQTTKPTVDWLGHLTQKRREHDFVEPTPQQLKEARLLERMQADQVVLDVLTAALDPAVFNRDAVIAFLETYGPFSHELARDAVHVLTDGSRGRSDHHIDVYLEAIRTHHKAQS